MAFKSSRQRKAVFAKLNPFSGRGRISRKPGGGKVDSDIWGRAVSIKSKKLTEIQKEWVEAKYGDLNQLGGLNKDRVVLIASYFRSKGKTVRVGMKPHEGWIEYTFRVR